MPAVKSKIKTLETWDEKHIPKRGYLIAAPHVAVFQIMNTNRPSGQRKIKSSSVSRRGAITDQSYGKRPGPGGKVEKPRQFPHVFEVASNPLNRNYIRQSMMGVLMEKIRNDLTAANGLLDQMGLDAITEREMGNRLSRPGHFA